MKYASLILVFSLFWLSFTIEAQNKFMVAQATGNNSVSSGAKVSVGAILNLSSGDKINVGSRLVLRQLSTGGTINIVQGGSYKVSDLIAGLKKKQSAEGRLANYVVRQVTNKDENINDNPQKYMQVTGSVDRAEPQSIYFFAFHTQAGEDKQIQGWNEYRVFSPEKVILKWHAVSGATGYNIVIKDFFGEEKLSEMVTDTSYTFAFNPADFGEDGALISITTEGVDGISPELLLEALPSDIQQEIQARYDEEVGDISTAEGKLTEALFFEKYGLYIDALRCYEEAIEMSSAGEKEGYQMIYAAFLHTHRNILEGI